MGSARLVSSVVRIIAYVAIASVLALAVYHWPVWRSVNRWLPGWMTAASPYEQYVSMLRASGLDRTALGQDFISAGEESLKHAVATPMPFRETGVFPSSAAHAVAYRLTLQRGRRLEVEVNLEATPDDRIRVAPTAASPRSGANARVPQPPLRHTADQGAARARAPARVFVDLFRIEGDGPPRRVASSAEQHTGLNYEVTQDGSYLLRVQPELLRGGRFTLTQRTLATLRFPIDGLTARAVQSFFGAERDAGARVHQGVDIFAPKGTAAIAVVDGIARPDTNRLGGTVVWLHDPLAGRTFYYAHLDRWAIDGLTRVRAGDVIGYVGSTGNARGASPHLHFGIYEHGAIDPLPYIRPDDELPPAAATGGVAVAHDSQPINTVRR
jgi:peptidoglycan LD-endopeptidase LytH